MRNKKIVCLANSRKLHGHCVAGKEVKPDRFGKWIRPVSSVETGELSFTDMAFQNNQVPQLLDIVKIPIKKYIPHDYQTENCLIDETKYWEHMGRIGISDLLQLCDPVEQLWINDFHTNFGLHDRIPLARARQQLNSSLLLIRPTELTLKVAQEYYSRKVRADFTFNGTRYCLVVTDPAVESIYRQQNDGIYPISRPDVYLCISLGEPYESYTYKLVAAIINLP